MTNKVLVNSVRDLIFDLNKRFPPKLISTRLYEGRNLVDKKVMQRNSFIATVSIKEKTVLIYCMNYWNLKNKYFNFKVKAISILFDEFSFKISHQHIVSGPRIIRESNGKIILQSK